MKRVTEFNERLIISKSLLESHASIVTLLRAIENSTAQTVKFKTIDITRKDKSTLAVTGILSTTNFDGALFQRTSYVAADIIKNPLFTDVKLTQPKAEDPKTKVVGEKTVELKVSFDFAVSDIVYAPTAVEVTTVRVGSSTDEESVNTQADTQKKNEVRNETNI